MKYQAAHHELLASAIATKIAHEVDPENQVGCMLAAGSNYAYTCKPEDVFALDKQIVKIISLLMSNHVGNTLRML